MNKKFNYDASDKYAKLGGIIAIATLYFLFSASWAPLLVGEAPGHETYYMVTHGLELILGIALFACLLSYKDIRNARCLVFGSALPSLVLIVPALVYFFGGFEPMLIAIMLTRPIASLALLIFAAWVVWVYETNGWNTPIGKESTEKK